MSSKTKIVVLKSKELIYTGIFIILGIMLILLLFYMFSPGKDKAKDKSANADHVSTSNDSAVTDQVAVSNINDINDINDTNENYSESAETSAGYIPGSYSSQLNLGGSTVLLTVTVDENKVTGVSMDNMDETLTAMYPLVQPSIDEINSQIGLVDSVEDITYSADNKYTTILILDAIHEALEDARR